MSSSETELVNCVNALKGATFISTQQFGMRCLNFTDCVNALKGATFISTNTGSQKALRKRSVSMP